MLIGELDCLGFLGLTAFDHLLDPSGLVWPTELLKWSLVFKFEEANDEGLGLVSFLADIKNCLAGSSSGGEGAEVVPTFQGVGFPWGGAVWW